MINIDEFAKVEMRVGEVVDSGKKEIMITCNGKSSSFSTDLRLKKGDKVVVIANSDSLYLLCTEKNIPIIPEKDIKEGSKVK